MNFRSLTSNGPHVSTLGLGGNIFGYACNDQQTVELIHAAETHGINFVDTADVYSLGRSEEMIGRALDGRRDHWVIATKVGVESGSDGRGKGARQVILERVEHSLRRLRTDYIDLYQLHHFDPVTPAAETVEAFAVLQRQGKIRHFGVSNCTAVQANLYISAASAAGLNPPASNQVHYNLFKRQAEIEFLRLPVATPPRLLAYGVLGRGILSGKYHASTAPQEDSRAARSAHVEADLQTPVLQAIAKLAEIGHAAGISMSQLATAYVLRSDLVVSALVGIRHVAQLDEVALGCSLHLEPSFWTVVDAFVERLRFDKRISLGEPALDSSSRAENSSEPDASASPVFYPPPTNSIHPFCRT